jgi:hypothetical protein
MEKTSEVGYRADSRSKIYSSPQKEDIEHSAEGGYRADSRRRI